MRVTLIPFTLPVGPQGLRGLVVNDEIQAGVGVSRLISRAWQRQHSPRQLTSRQLTARQLRYVRGALRESLIASRLGGCSYDPVAPTLVKLVTNATMLRRIETYTQKLWFLQDAWVRKIEATIPFNPLSFAGDASPAPVFLLKDWDELQRAMTAIVQFLHRLVELLRALLRVLPFRLLPPPAPPLDSAPCAVARMQGTRVPRAPQTEFSYLLLVP
ncbi:hypothetical protein [Streptomyces sp. SPB162]|uniref:hypothetical protein n=1 Tax=Streptomyces sp. SPB162 TaxID=2940560 RepID=UPI0024052A8E|nr:hypothetical protein [Streptomyces sp. SPB162]MDF9812991.1 hypothetical protein [Streptomyces sp. SPB162]